MNGVNNSAAALFRRVGERLDDEYSYMGKRYKDLCAAIAYALGKELIRIGCAPTIEQIISPEDRILGIKPIRFSRTVGWKAPVACVCDQLAWDPFLQRLEPRDSYSKALFGEEFPMKPWRTTEQIQAYPQESILIDFS